MFKLADWENASLEAAAYLVAPVDGERFEPNYEPMSDTDLDRILAQDDGKRHDLHAAMSAGWIDEYAAEVASFQEAQLQTILNNWPHLARRPRKVDLVKREAARQALAHLYPGGIPGIVELPNKLLCAAVQDQLKRLPYKVSDATILRAAGRKLSEAKRVK